MTTTLTATSPEVLAFLTAWHENGRASFERNYSNLHYDTYKAKFAKPRTRFLALDFGSSDGTQASGAFLVDRTTREVSSISGYGRPNRKIGRLEDLTRAYELATAKHLTLPGPGYVETDKALRIAGIAATLTDIPATEPVGG